MSVLASPYPNNAPDLEIMNNGASEISQFDDSSAIRASRSPLQPLELNSFDEIYGFDRTKSPIPIKAIQPKGGRGKPLKLLFKQGLLPPPSSLSFNLGKVVVDDDSKIDIEIQDVEREMSRLSSKLESLRLEKEEKDSKTTIEDSLGKNGVRIEEDCMKLAQRNLSVGPLEIISSERCQTNVKPENCSFLGETTPCRAGGITRLGRRGISLGPSEIIANVRCQNKVKPEITPLPVKASPFAAGGSARTGRRGMSMGPSEIAASVKSQQKAMPVLTPVIAKGHLSVGSTNARPARRAASIGRSEISSGVRSEQKKNLETTTFQAKGCQSALCTSTKPGRRGVTMGPLEIMAGTKSLQKVKLDMTPCNFKGWQSGPGTSTKFGRRGVSMVSSEISAGIKSLQKPKLEMTPFQVKGWQSGPGASTKFGRRGVSMGPSEISVGLRSQQNVKPEITPQLKDRQKSCLKAQEVGERKVMKKTGGWSLSLSPKSRLSVTKARNSKNGLKTVGSKQPPKKEDGALSSIQSQNNFEGGEKSGVRRSLTKTARVIPSRYNQIPTHSSQKLVHTDQSKKLLLETGSPLECDLNETSEEDHEALVNTNSPTILKIADMLPKIRTIRCMSVSPRDSGQAKRVADLVGRKVHFGPEEADMETSVSQVLRYDEENIDVETSVQILSYDEEEDMDIETSGEIMSCDEE
ncbi:hypothetical protein GIB67_040326 [Kingdonia uniflora]|uniref:Uncharacterized protein n=1 Tax=Kingdonia uniflora TaxID=39325 RepID=A0A7J7L708_9MAGN|nr:hypothetical protein GIB67_040326 [Kingdonia uniflora]